MHQVTRPALHFGPVPKNQRQLDDIRHSHQLGFRTILLSEYKKLEAAGIPVEAFDFVLDATDLEPAP